MEGRILLEHPNEWAVIHVNFIGEALETGRRESGKSEEEAVNLVPKGFIEMSHDKMHIIFGDSYRRIFVEDVLK